MFSLIVNTATISCLLFLALLAATKKSRNFVGYRFLAILFIALSFNFTDEVLVAAGTYTRYPWLAVIFQPVLYLFAPVIYWAVIYLTSVSQKLVTAITYHFLPYFITLLLYLKAYVFTDADIRTLHDAAVSTDGDSVDEVFMSLFFVQIAVYMYFSLKALNRHRKSLPLFVSNLPDNDYHWLYNVIVGLSILFVASFAEVVSDRGQTTGIFPIIYLLGFYYVGLHVARQRDVFSFSKEQVVSLSDLVEDQWGPDSEKAANEPIAAADESVKPDGRGETESTIFQKKKTISDEKLAQYQQRLQGIMETERPYMDSEITLPKLGKIMLLNTYQTSYLINTSFGENFYNFINRYRLEECKKMFSNREFDHLSILDIAFESGFNSKTSFNTAFKKYTGCSPSEFRERNRAQSAS